MRLLLTALATVLVGAVVASPAGADAGRRRCRRVDGYPMLAFNLSCHRARRIWHHLPSGWAGANQDDVDGGRALLFRARDEGRVLAAETRHGLSLRKLRGAPVVFVRVPYESERRSAAAAAGT